MSALSRPPKETIVSLLQMEIDKVERAFIQTKFELSKLPTGPKSTIGKNLNQSDKIIKELKTKVARHQLVEQILKKSGKEFVNLFHRIIPIIIITTLKEGRFIHVNDAFRRTLGFTPAETIGHTIFELSLLENPSDFKKIPSLIRKNPKRRTIKTILPLITKNKKRLVCQAAFQIIRINKEVWLQGTLKDITREQTSKDRLHSAENFAQNLIQSTDAMVVALDVAGHILIFNKAAEDITGYKHKELQGRNWFEALVPKRRFPQVWEIFQGV